MAVNAENLLAHNRVNAAVLAVSTPLPFRFGTRAAPERLAEYVVDERGGARRGARARARLRRDGRQAHGEVGRSKAAKSEVSRK